MADENLESTLGQLKQEFKDVSKSAAKSLGTKLINYADGKITNKPINKKVEFMDYYQPSLLDIRNYFESKGIVGEQSVAILSTLAMLNGNSVIVQGSSGSGKSVIQEALLDIIPENFVYKLGLTTIAALSRDADTINSARALYVGEFQKVMGNKDLKEIFKDISNGDEFSRKLTAPNGEVQNLTIRGDLSLHTALAEENAFQAVFGNQAESFRRFIHLYTRMDGTSTQEILQYKAMQDADPFGQERTRKDKQNKLLPTHISAVMTAEPFEIVNPYTPYVIPNGNNEMLAAFFTHYQNLMKAHAGFFKPSRVKFSKNGKKYLVASIEDVKNIHDLYQPHFLRSIQRLGKLEESEIENLFQIDWYDCFTQGSNFIKRTAPGIYNSWMEQQSKTYVAYSLEPDKRIAKDLGLI